jgi:transcriptional regulator with XRE-family HTH domain
MNLFGEKIRLLREGQNLLQRQVASQLDIDTPMLSKIERGERLAKKEQVIILADLFKVGKDDLLSIWLADKVYDIVKDEDVALKAIQVAENQIKYHKKTK